MDDDDNDNNDDNNVCSLQVFISIHNTLLLMICRYESEEHLSGRVTCEAAAPRE